MTIKKYFENNSFSNNSLTDLENKEGVDFESFEYLEELEEQRSRFIPNVDFSKPENFTRQFKKHKGTSPRRFRAVSI